MPPPLATNFGAELLRDLRSRDRSELEQLLAAGPPVVQLQVAWLLQHVATLELYATSASHAISIRGITGLLKLDPAALVRLAAPEVEEEVYLSSACRTVALKSLGRLGHGALRALAPRLERLLRVAAPRTAARILLKGATEPELIRDHWTKLLKDLPFKAAFSLASRMPMLCLQLIFATPPPHWQPQQLARAVSVAVAASPGDALRVMDQMAMDGAGVCLGALGLVILKSLIRCQVALEDLLQALGQWLEQSAVTVDGTDGWSSILSSLVKRVCRGTSGCKAQLLDVTVQLMKRMDPASACNLAAAAVPLLETDEQLQQVCAAVPAQHLGLLWSSLRLPEQRLESAAEEALRHLAVKDLKDLGPWIPRFSSWPLPVRQRLAERLTALAPLEVPGSPVPEEYLELLTWRPASAVMNEIKQRCNNSNALARQAGFNALIRCAARDGQPALEDALTFFVRRLKNEQDNIRTEVLQHMTNVVPLLFWQPSHVKSLKQLLSYSLQAKGSSSASLNAWRGVTEVLLANGVAFLDGQVNNCGKFALETMQHLQDVRVWPQDDMNFGAAVLQRLVDLETLPGQPAFTLTANMVDWLVIRFLRPGVQELLRASRVAEACSQLVHWNSIRLQRSRRSRRAPETVTSPALTSLALEGFGAASRALSSWWSWSSASQQLITFLLQFPLQSDSPELLAAQEEAIHQLSEQCSKPAFMRVFDWMCELVPWHWTYSLHLLAQQGAWLQKNRPERLHELLNGLCRAWDCAPDVQRLSLAPSIVGFRERMEAFVPLLQRIWLWRFSFDISERLDEAKQFQAAWALRTKIQLRKQAEQLLLGKKRKKRAAARALLDSWADQPEDFRLELLCTSDFLLRSLQWKPQQLQLLLPCHNRAKLQDLRRLVWDFRVPLHFMKETKASQVARPFFQWPAEFQTAFTEFWCLPALTEPSMRSTLQKSCGEHVIVRCAQLLLAMPMVDSTEPLDLLMDFCAATLGAADDNTAAPSEDVEEAMLRGSAWADEGWPMGGRGRVLDQLVLLLAASDRPSAVLSIFEKQLGRGVSKQAARSFQRLLRRMAPQEAQKALEKQLDSEATGERSLKVAEQVALVRLMGEFLGKAAVKPLKKIWQRCQHRDVAGAVLCQLCHASVSCEDSATLVEEVCAKVKAGNMEPYQLQVLLQHLRENPCDDRVAGILVTLTAGATLAALALGALVCWAKQQHAMTSTSQAVAAAATEVLCCFDAGWQDAAHEAALCLVQLGRLQPELLQNSLQCLTSMPSTAALLRLKGVAHQLAQEMPAVRAVAAAGLLACGGAAARWGLDLWAQDLPWNEASQLVRHVTQLPSAILEEPLFLAPMLHSCRSSLHSWRRCHTGQQAQDTAQRLAQIFPTLGGSAMLAMLVLLLAIGNLETLDQCLAAYGSPSLALQVLLTEVGDPGLSNTAQPGVVPDVFDEEFFDDEDD